MQQVHFYLKATCYIIAVCTWLKLHHVTSKQVRLGKSDIKFHLVLQEMKDERLSGSWMSKKATHIYVKKDE